MRSKRKLLLAGFATLAILIAAWAVLLAGQGRDLEFLKNHEHQLRMRVVESRADVFLLRGEFDEVSTRVGHELSSNSAWTEEGPENFLNSEDGREIVVVSAEEFWEVAPHDDNVEISEHDLAFFKSHDRSKFVCVVVFHSEPLEMLQFRLRKLGRGL